MVSRPAQPDAQCIYARARTYTCAHAWTCAHTYMLGEFGKVVTLDKDRCAFEHITRTAYTCTHTHVYKRTRTHARTHARMHTCRHAQEGSAACVHPTGAVRMESRVVCCVLEGRHGWRHRYGWMKRSRGMDGSIEGMVCEASTHSSRPSLK